MSQKELKDQTHRTSVQTQISILTRLKTYILRSQVQLQLRAEEYRPKAETIRRQHFQLMKRAQFQPTQWSRVKGWIQDSHLTITMTHWKHQQTCDQEDPWVWVHSDGMKTETMNRHLGCWIIQVTRPNQLNLRRRGWHLTWENEQDMTVGVVPQEDSIRHLAASQAEHPKTCDWQSWTHRKGVEQYQH